eukprot:359264-Chlamydomonas_euryale.AAC.7
MSTQMGRAPAVLASAAAGGDPAGYGSASTATVAAAAAVTDGNSEAHVSCMGAAGRKRCCMSVLRCCSRAGERPAPSTD